MHQSLRAFDAAKREADWLRNPNINREHFWLEFLKTNEQDFRNKISANPAASQGYRPTILEEKKGGEKKQKPNATSGSKMH